MQGNRQKLPAHACASTRKNSLAEEKEVDEAIQPLLIAPKGNETLR